MPGLKRYGEISSASNCTDYQSRRLNIRYRRALRPCRIRTSIIVLYACAEPLLVTSCFVTFRPAASKDSVAIDETLGKKKGSKAGAGGKTEFVHTLNATACAVPRMIVAIIENFQQVCLCG